MRLAPVLLAFLVCGCASSQEEDEIHDPSDFDLISDNKGDGTFDTFNAERIVPDDAFFDVDAMSAAEVQTFLEETPYNKRSFLADFTLTGGEKFSAALVRVSKASGFNPLVMLTHIQKEKGLISRSQTPSRQRIDFAFGCGCFNGGCQESFRGIDKQLQCAADRMVEYRDDLLSGQTTISGWAPGTVKTTEDQVRVNPANRATAILYTYTPFTLSGQGGNWLFWNIWRKYAKSIDYDMGMTFPFNEGYIGGACTTDSDCFFAGGVCDLSGGRGLCTKSCDRVCPDRSGPGWATTFCVNSAQNTGSCRAQCESSPCVDGQSCVSAARNGETSVRRKVCVLN